MAACISVRRDRSLLPVAISPAARLMLSADCWMRETMLESCAMVLLASSRMRANTPWNSPRMVTVRSPSAKARSRPEIWPRLSSLVRIIVFSARTISRKSCSKRLSSPRWVKSPAAAAVPRCLISALIAARFCLMVAMVSVMTRFSPGSVGMSGVRSPTA
ncbi:hypothetical protein D3C81_1781400 [compost metagenome]